MVQETAVAARQKGRCGRPACALPISEIDHLEEWARTKHTTLDELFGLCGRDHDLKTSGGHSYRREADGSVTWVRPDGSVPESEDEPDLVAYVARSY
jgi:hypothetical protein